ncbi:MAG: hypothetical protein M0Q45_07470 [Bacteroidales bacterium]|nr:hypothetical protein [Bacteroidales bacterium]MCK9499328.1 hypothetical protein [Bacteroidales bacterium]
MKKFKIFIALLIFMSFVSSCVTTRIATFDKNENIELYTSKLPSQNYSEICYIQADGGTFHSPQNLLNGLVKKAVQVKADAIVNIKFDFQGIWPLASGTAIKYIK